MMKNNAVYILLLSSFSDKTDNELLCKFSIQDIEYYRITTCLNLIENLLLQKDKLDVFLILNDSDKEKISSDLTENQIKVIQQNHYDLKSILTNLSANKFSSYKNNFLILSDVIDFRPTDLDKHLSVLSIDDKAFSVSKSRFGNIKVFGFNNFNEEFIKYLVESNFILDKFLSYNKSCAYFVNILNDVLEIANQDDFKKLYSELSLKSSYEYCSEKMHERFTHIFIEYKDLLK